MYLIVGVYQAHHLNCLSISSAFPSFILPTLWRGHEIWTCTCLFPGMIITVHHPICDHNHDAGDYFAPAVSWLCGGAEAWVCSWVAHLTGGWDVGHTSGPLYINLGCNGSLSSIIHSSNATPRMIFALLLALALGMDCAGLLIPDMPSEFGLKKGYLLFDSGVQV